MLRGFSPSYLLALLIFAAIPAGCGGSDPGPAEEAAETPSLVSFSGLTMGTSYHITYRPRSQASPTLEAVREAVTAEFNRLIRMVSTYEPDSDLSRFNRHASLEPFPVSTELAHLVEQALHIARETEGAFDPTVLPLVRLFGFGPGDTRKPPSRESVQAVRAYVGYGLVEVDPSCSLVHSHPQVELALHGLAQGYGVDLAGRVLDTFGFEAWMVEIGGEVLTHGYKPRKRPWIIGIEAPFEGAPFGQRIHGKVALINTALATSGDYRNFRKNGGRRWHHILDPHTLENPVNDLASVTVIAPTCTVADALATGLMVLGPKKGAVLLKRFPGGSTLFIRRLKDGSFATSMTSGFPLLDE